ncbi:MAG: iron-containing alcohol dehydrogenase, partial [Bacteroidota bacterium]
MSIKRMILNETSYFGAGSRSVLADEIKKRGFKKVFVVTDPDLLRFGVAGEVTSILGNAEISYVVFSDLKQNPTVKQVKLGCEEFASSKADVIVAIGGGSSIDAAKAIGIIAANPEFADVVSLEGVADTKNKSIPVIALPTTAGTAAEVTINYVITDEENIKKMVCVDPNDIAILSIVDPELMVSMPKGLTAATGMDALTHAIEGYITKGAWEMSDMFELKAIEMIAKYLPRAVENPADIEARDGMAMAQYIAGMGFSNVGLGLVHGMAHPLGAYFDVPHGVANALLLPIVMKYNASSCVEKYGDIARAMGV